LTLRTPTLWLVLLLLAAALQVCCQEQTPNLVANGGFEQVGEDGMPESWGTWLKELPEPGCISVDDTVAHSGDRSLKISQADPTSYSMMTQRVEFAPQKQYVITAWIRGEGIDGGENKGCARLFVGQEGNNPYPSTPSPAFRDTLDWRFIELGPFDAKERTWLTLIPYLHRATGTVWFDDISLREVTPADLRRRAQRRAREIAMTDLDAVEQAAREAGADALLPEITGLRRRLETTDDLPTSLPSQTPVPWFPLHEQVFTLMARVNQANWAGVEDCPTVEAQWAIPFDDARPVMACKPGAEAPSELVEMVRGEVEQACVRLTNLTTQPQTASLSVTLLSAQNQSAIPPGNLTWRALRYVELRPTALLPDPLVRIGTGAGPIEVALAPGMTRDVWLMISSDSVEAGLYEGRLSVTANDGKRDLRLSARVYPLDFPDQVPIHTFAYAYTFWSILKGRTLESRADLINHRINTYVIQRYFTPWPQFDDEGNWLGLKWDKMDEQIALHPDAKCFLLIPSLYSSDDSGRMPPKTGPDYPSDEWKALVARWARELAEGMKKRGFDYDQWGVYLVDEPSGERARKARHGGDAVRMGDPNIRRFANPYGSATDEDMELMAPAVDIWCPMLNTAKGERLGFCRKTAPEVWMYQVLSKRSHPLGAYRLGFWKAFVKELGGYGFWDYADCSGSAWDAYDNPRHDYGVVYDGDETDLTPSRRWEGYREGAEDFMLLSMLAERPGWDRQKVSEFAQQVIDAGDAASVHAARRKMIRLIAGVAE